MYTLNRPDDGHQQHLGLQPLDPSFGRHDAQERAGYEKFGRNPQRARNHQSGHAERAGRGHRSVGSQGK